MQISEGYFSDGQYCVCGYFSVVCEEFGRPLGVLPCGLGLDRFFGRSKLGAIEAPRRDRFGVFVAKAEALAYLRQ